MHLGQTMLTLGFFALLTISVMNANRMIVKSDQEMYEGEAFDYAANFAQALLSEASSKIFDVKVIDSLFQQPNKFTTPSQLGPSASESISPWPDVAPYKSIGTYNDVDDYHGYERTVDTDILKGFKVTCVVYYVTETDPDTPSSSQTYFKRVDVSLEHVEYLKKVTYSSIVSYY